MGINGVEAHRVELSPLELDLAREAFAVGQLAVFGTERLSAVEENIAPPDSVQDFVLQVEHLCTGMGSRGFRGISYRNFPNIAGRRDKTTVELTWNPAGTLGGFGFQSGWDGAIASVGGLSAGRVLARPPGGVVPLPHRVTEGIYVDSDSGLAMVRRSLVPSVWGGPSRSSVKPAVAGELDEARGLLACLIESDAEILGTSPESQLPRYLEVGFGLDPSAIRGQRRFSNKVSLNIDRAVGDYAITVGSYPDAVRARSRQYADFVADKKAGQHIFFAIGDAGLLPFLSDSIREVFLSNVLNANLDDDTRTGIVSEANRVLEANGCIVVRVNWNQDAWTQHRMVSLLTENGLHVVRSIDYSDQEYSSLEAQYGSPLEVPAPEGYYLIASPSPRSVK